MVAVDRGEPGGMLWAQRCTARRWPPEIAMSRESSPTPLGVVR